MLIGNGFWARQTRRHDVESLKYDVDVKKPLTSDRDCLFSRCRLPKSRWNVNLVTTLEEHIFVATIILQRLP